MAITPITLSNIEQVLENRVPPHVMNALKAAFKWAEGYRGSSDFPHMALGYLREMDRADKFGIREGRPAGYALKLNILYALGNMNGWSGEEARAAKKVLRSYTSCV